MVSNRRKRTGRQSAEGQVKPPSQAGRGPQPEVSGLQAAAGNQAVSELLAHGRPLDNATRATLESQLGGDFSQVRLHTGPTADQVTGQQDAYAVTIDQDVFLGRSVADARGPVGRFILGHELAHVVQQSRPGLAAAQTALESEATLAGLQVAGGKTAAPALAAPSGPQTLGRKARNILAGAGLGLLGGLVLGATVLGVAALAGATLGGGAIAGALLGGAALGGLVGGLIGGTRKGEEAEQPAAPVEGRITPEQAAWLTEGSSWEELIAAAKAMRAAGETALAEQIYKFAILKVAGRVTPPAGVPPRTPTLEDIQIDFALGPRMMFESSADATTYGLRVPEHPDNYWRWIDFGPGALRETEAHTENVIIHELAHVRQFLNLWQSYQATPPERRGTWKDFLAPTDVEQLRVRERIALGAEELEAHITILDYLTRLAPQEAEKGLEALLVAYVLTADFTPPEGEPVPITTETAAPAIRTAFERSDARMRTRMGEQLWRALIRVDPPAATWERVIRDLQPLADEGYRDTALRPSYDDFLAYRGLRYADIVGR